MHGSVYQVCLFIYSICRYGCICQYACMYVCLWWNRYWLLHALSRFCPHQPAWDVSRRQLQMTQQGPYEFESHILSENNIVMRVLSIIFLSFFFPLLFLSRPFAHFVLSGSSSVGISGSGCDAVQCVHPCSVCFPVRSSFGRLAWHVGRFGECHLIPSPCWRKLVWNRYPSEKGFPLVFKTLINFCLFIRLCVCYRVFFYLVLYIIFHLPFSLFTYLFVYLYVFVNLPTTKF